MLQPPEISVIIPTRNGEGMLPGTLDAVFGQRCDERFEVLVIDSESTDRTCDIVSKYPARLHGIKKEEFSHSGTRNLGARMSSATRWLVFLNQDATPTDERWLANLVASMSAGPGLKAVSAAEVVRNGDRPYLSGCSSYVFHSVDASGVHVIEPHVLERSAHLSRPAQRALFPFSTVCAMFEKTHFLAHPFDERLPWGEDLGWAVASSRAGFASGCTASARVYHHHDYTPEELRVIMEHTARLYGQVFGWSLTADQLLAEYGGSPDPEPPRRRPWDRALRAFSGAARRVLGVRDEGRSQ
jgi:glycosyltransferase involved in cell wall biosynthesis